MRLLAVFIMFFLATPINAKAEASSEQASQPKASGMIYATVKVSDDLKTEFLDGPNSELPDDIITKISPLLMTKARDTHAAMPADDGIYRVAVDWKIVSVDGQDQMKFEYRNAEPYPIRKVEPVYSLRNSTTPVEIVYRVDVATDGSVTGVSRDAGSSGNTDLYRAGREAIKRWKFFPRYKDGVAVAGDVQIPLTFNDPTDLRLEVPQVHGL